MATTAAIQPTSAGRARFIKIAILLVDEGTPIIRGLFDSFHSPLHLARALQTLHKAVLKHLKAKKILNQDEWKTLFPSKSSCGTSKDFDLTLLFKLLRHICNLTEPSTGWDKLPQDTDLSLEADIARVKYHRNETYAHVIKLDISEKDFSDYWKQISNALCRILTKYSDPSIVKEWEERIGKIRTGPVSEGDIKNYLYGFPALVIKAVFLGLASYVVMDQYKEEPISLLSAIKDAILPTAGIIVQEMRKGSVEIVLRVLDLEALEDLWQRYKTEKLRNDLIKVLKKEIRKLGDRDLDLTCTLYEDEYLYARDFLKELMTYKKKALESVSEVPEAKTRARKEFVQITESMQELMYQHIKAYTSKVEKEVEEVVETIEELSLCIVHGKTITDRKSEFQAHFAEVTSKDQADQVLSYFTKSLPHTELSNIIWAYRGFDFHGSDDGDEYLAGRRLEHLLNEINVVNVIVIVTCLDGDVYLGLDKFKNINECALNLLMSHKLVQPMTSKEVELFLEKIENYFELRKHKAAYVAYQAATEATKPKDEFEIIHSQTITVPKSSFQGHLARVASEDQVDQVLAQLKQNRKIANARFNMFAYRIYDEEKKEPFGNHRDDGEHKGGKTLLQLLQTSNIENAVVIVTRWKESEHVELGVERFKHIKRCATEVIKIATELGWFATKASGVEKKESKKKGKAKSTKK